MLFLINSVKVVELIIFASSKIILDNVEEVHADQFESPLGQRIKRDTDNHLYETLQCPRRYCEAGNLQTFCSPSQSCPNTRNLPNCWFSLGVTSVDTQTYYHYLNVRISCLPVCIFKSLDPRMPAIDDVSSVGAMCNWYNSHGRCPEFERPR